MTLLSFLSPEISLSNQKQRLLLKIEFIISHNKQMTVAWEVSERVSKQDQQGQ